MTLKLVVIAVWLFGSALAVSHLMFLGGSPRSDRFWEFAGIALVCYSAPFAALLMIRVPRAPLAERLITLTGFGAVLAISLYLPGKRFLPGYHPAALEGLAYLFVPVFQFGVIATALILRAVNSWLRQRG